MSFPHSTCPLRQYTVKIGLIIYGSLDTMSGGYLYDRQLVRHLRKAGHTVEVISLPWRNYVAHLGDNFRRSWLRALAQQGYDILLQDELNHPSLAWLNSIWHAYSNAPIIAVVHHLRSSEQHPRLLLPLYRYIEARYVRSVDGFIYNSSTTRTTVRRLLPAPKPGVVAYPAADHLVVPDHDSVMAKLEARVQDHTPVQILFVGNIIPRKGLHLLLEALTGLNKSLAWRLHVVGSETVDSTYSQRVRTQAINQFPPGQVTWHGRVDDDNLRTLYESADLLAVPSYEGFGIVYLEAMAFGLPVIAAQAGAARELVTPGANGQLVPLTDPSSLCSALQTYIGNRINLAVQGYAARRRFERHPTWFDSMQIALDWLHESFAPHHVT